MIGSTIAYRSLGTTSVLVQAPRTPNDAELNQWVDELVSIGVERVLVFASSGGMTAKQRKTMVAKLVGAGLAPRTAIVTGSAAARGVVTAIGWFQPYPLRAFSESEVEAALEFIGAFGMHDNLLSVADNLRSGLHARIASAG